MDGCKGPGPATILHVATATVIENAPAHAPANRPNMVSVGTIVWLSSELMFFAALFAMYFTAAGGEHRRCGPAITEILNIPFATVNTIILVLSSVTCQLGVFAAERGDVRRAADVVHHHVRHGLGLHRRPGHEYAELVKEGLTLASSAYGSVFYLTTGFHGLHVTGGLIAFLFVLGRTYVSRRFTHRQATTAIVVSYYWHFVDVVWIGLFAMIYLIK